MHFLISCTKNSQNIPNFSNNSLTTGLVEIIFSSLINSVTEKLGNYIGEKISENKNTKMFNNIINQSPERLNKMDLKIHHNTDSQGEIDNLCDIILSILSSIQDSMSCVSFLLIGPPGTGKTTIFYQVFKLCREKLEEITKNNPDLTSISEIDPIFKNQIIKIKKQIKSNQYIISVFIPGTFFERFGDDKTSQMNKFFNILDKYLADGHMVLLFIDEVDAAAPSTSEKQRSSGAAELIFQIDRIKQRVVNKGSLGKLIIGATTNGSNIDYAIGRRISEIFIVLDLPDIQSQRELMKIKLNHIIEVYLKKGENDRLNFNIKNVLKTIEDDFFSFEKFGIRFSPAEIENIVWNMASTLMYSRKNNLDNFGGNMEIIAVNCLKFYMLKEASKILILNKKKLQIEVINIIDSLKEDLKTPKNIPKISIPPDWIT